MKRDNYIIFRVNKFFHSLGKARVFKTMNVNFSYQQTENDNKDIDNTACDTHCELFRYTKTLRGLKNVSETFSKRHKSYPVKSNLVDSRDLHRQHSHLTKINAENLGAYGRSSVTNNTYRHCTKAEKFSLLLRVY